MLCDVVGDREIGEVRCDVALVDVDDAIDIVEDDKEDVEVAKLCDNVTPASAQTFAHPATNDA